MGLGPMTGHGGGYCAGRSAPGELGRIGQAGLGGFGRGRGSGRWHRRRVGRARPWGTGGPGPAPFREPIDPMASTEHQLELLQAEAQSLEHTLNVVKQRMRDIQSQDDARATAPPAAKEPASE
jgi:hypothetical protein